jgi:hypothetical protein
MNEILFENRKAACSQPGSYTSSYAKTYRYILHAAGTPPLDAIAKKVIIEVLQQCVRPFTV